MTKPSLPGIEARHFRYFVAASEYGSLRKAAAALDIQKSTISRSIRDLEDRLGASLFQRHWRDKLCRVVLLSGLTREYIGNGAQFELGHESTPIGFENEVTRDHNAHREAGANGQGRRDGKLTTDGLIAGAADRVLSSLAYGASDVIVIIGAQFRTNVQDGGETSLAIWLRLDASRNKAEPSYSAISWLAANSVSSSVK